MESTEDYCKRIGSREAMEERQRERLAGNINKKLYGERNAGMALALLTTDGHQWKCECYLCRPWLWDGDEKIGTDRGEQHPQFKQPTTIIAVKQEPLPKGKGFPKPRKKWSEQRGRSTN